jgi:protocatechuate 3,4-dioxygenase, beta subunit
MVRGAIIFSLLALLASCANSQQQTPPAFHLVGSCEGCEAVFEYDNKPLKPTDTLPDFSMKGTKIKLAGTIYQPDGKTPAPGVILYIYHTDTSGVYPTKGNETGWARRHGYIRGWIKTDNNGQYSFYTLRPQLIPGEPSRLIYMQHYWSLMVAITGFTTTILMMTPCLQQKKLH